MTVADAYALTMAESRYMDANDFWSSVAAKSGLSVKKARQQASALGLLYPPAQRKNHRFCR